MKVPIVRLGLSMLAGVLASVSLVAQNLPQSSQPAKPAFAGPTPGPPQSRTEFGPYFGLTATTWQKITAPEFDPDTSGTYTSTWNPPSNYYYGRYVTGGFPHVVASPHLPTGAHVTSIRFEYCDTNGTGQHMDMNLYDCDQTGCNSTPVYAFNSSSFVVCSASYTAYGFIDYTVDNLNRQLLIDVTFGATDATNQLASVSLGYQLQVSPAPGSATFLDVPLSDPAFQYIEALVASGVTAGCGGGNYCPDNPVTRRQMAVFLAKALGLNWPG
jgi:hypothetical protein